MKAEIVTIGTEIMVGDTMDTHSSYLSRQCTALGIPVHLHSSVDDDRQQLLQLFRVANQRSDLIFVCGGLGPTMDDITKETLADFLGVELIQDEQVVKQLEKLFESRNQKPSPNNYRQTFVFPNGKVFPNKNGTAPGLAITQNQTTYVLLPGPPKELAPLFEHQVRPYLQQKFPLQKAFMIWDLSFFGIGESKLEHQLEDLIHTSINPRIATYISETGVILRLTGKDGDSESIQGRMQQIKQEILSRVGEYCYSDQRKTLEEVVVEQLHNQQKTVAFAESCTGGLLTHLVSTVPGSSQVLQGGIVSYSNQAKIDFGLASPEILSTYGAVDSTTARSMAEKSLEQFQSDFAFSVTGVAGPSLMDNQPVGCVYIGFAETGGSTQVFRFLFHGSRKRIQLTAARQVLFLLQRRLRKGEATS